MKADFELRSFTSSPEAFVLITDEAAIVEQYHYGIIKPTLGIDERKILGGNIPIIEYENVDDSHSPYMILKDHMEHVFKYHSKTLT